MFFESASDIPKIAKRTHAAVFVMPDSIPINIKNAVSLQPEEKTVITIEQIRKLLPRLAAKQVSDLFIIIRPAEALNAEAASAMLKSLEEPGDKVHFILVTSMPSLILPTILSRTALYILKTPANKEITASPKTKELAKKLLVAKGADLVKVAEEITKKKDGVRNYTLEVLEVAIEMLYQTYFITKKAVFIKKLPRFLAAYDAVAQNGHVKLQIVSNLC